ncbi:MAG: diaminopimelate decarboxylase family protein [Thermodesulfobacteriota bacterium]
MDDLLQKARGLLTSPSPAMNENHLEVFVRSCLRHRDLFLDLAQGNSSPLYALDEIRLISKAHRFRRVFEEAVGAVDVFFAMKSNNMPDISRILTGAGLGLDVSSGLELEQALAVNAQRIIFSGPGKTDDELRLALEHAGRVTVLLDSFGELERLAHLSDKQNQTIHAGVRLTTNPHGLWRKFGIPLDRLGDFMEQARQHERISLCGLQFHTSWNLTPTAQTDFLKQLGRKLHDMGPESRKSLRFIDIGGGYWPEQGEWLRTCGTPEGRLLELLAPERLNPRLRHCLRSSPLEFFAQAVATVIREHFPKDMERRIWLEPGRWLCHEALHLLMRVVDVKAPDLVITDCGTNAVGWERFEQDYFPVINLTRPGVTENPCHILGSLCTPHDVWGFSYHGTDIQPGDLLLIPTQGAYTYSLRQNFIKPLPRIARLPVEVVLDWPPNFS